MNVKHHLPRSARHQIPPRPERRDILRRSR
jgi:hypothetical protein